MCILEIITSTLFLRILLRRDCLNAYKEGRRDRAAKKEASLVLYEACGLELDGWTEDEQSMMMMGRNGANHVPS